MVPISILDLVPVVVGETPREALTKSLELAQHAESFGYKRFWVAEHHNMTGIASAATSVVIGYLACGTSSIRVGSGGIMSTIRMQWLASILSLPIRMRRRDGCSVR